jgi:DNA-binding NarL/FixJ family response regulator
VGCLQSAEEVVETVQRLRPDVVVLDLDMPGRGSFAALRALAQRCPEARVLIYSGHVRADLVDEALELGAWGYVSKEEPVAAIIDAIRSVGDGKMALGKTVTELYLGV